MRDTGVSPESYSKAMSPINKWGEPMDFVLKLETSDGFHNDELAEKAYWLYIGTTVCDSSAQVIRSPFFQIIKYLRNVPLQYDMIYNYGKLVSGERPC